MPAIKVNLKDKLNDNELDLSMSDLQEVPVKDISVIKKATILDLSNNQLTVLGHNFATSLVHLVKLDLSQNQIKELPENFGELRNLRDLDLYNNKLQHLPLSLGQCKHLRWLDLKNNPLAQAFAEVAGPCLDAKQCQQCAKKIVPFLNSLQSQLTKEYERRVAQKKRDKEEAAQQILLQNNLLKMAKKNQKAEKKQKNEQATLVTETYTETNIRSQKNKDIKKLQKPKAKFSVISFFVKLLTFNILLGAVIVSGCWLLSTYDPKTYGILRESACRTWNRTLEILPPVVIQKSKEAYIYAEPTINLTKDLCTVMWNTSSAKIKELYLTVADQEFFKGISMGFYQTYRYIYLKALDLFDRAAKELPAVIEVFKKRFLE